MTLVDLHAPKPDTLKKGLPTHNGTGMNGTGHGMAPSVAPAAPALVLDRAKFAYSTRFVANHPERAGFGIDTSLSGAPRSGDVVLARVVKLGHHKRLESPDSRRQILFPGDLIVVAYGDRYAADQFLATVPEDLDTCHLVAAGGLASRVEEKHDKVADATVIEPVGLLTDARGAVLNVRDCAPHGITTATNQRSQVPVIAVLGTSMNSGKSTTLAHLAHGLVRAGLRVHTGKATGTGAGNDSHLFSDAGAHRVLDFTDFGYTTTFNIGQSELLDLFSSMVGELSSDSGAGAPDVVLIEIADGVYQEETARLLAGDLFSDRVDALVFAAADALGAAGGVQVLQTMERTPALVSGVFTSSPLATREAMAVVDAPVVNTFELAEPAIAAGILEMVTDGAVVNGR